MVLLAMSGLFGSPPSPPPLAARCSLLAADCIRHDVLLVRCAFIAGAELASHAYSFPFYYVFIELVRSSHSRFGLSADLTPAQVTQEVLRLKEDTQEFDKITELAADVISSYVGTQSSNPPYMDDKAFKETGNWEGVVKSYRVNAENIDEETPKFRQTIDVGKAALRVGIR